MFYGALFFEHNRIYLNHIPLIIDLLASVIYKYHYLTLLPVIIRWIKIQLKTSMASLIF